MKKCIILGSQL